jgi:hypothetical protein
MDAHLMDTVSAHDPFPYLPAPGKDEMNFAEHPIALLTDRVPKDQRSLICEDTVYSQRRKKLLTRKRVIEGSQEYGLPTATDDAVVLALIQLTKLKNDFSQREVEFTRLELIRMLGWPNEGKSYDRIKLSLFRIKGVRYFYDNAWWDARLKDWTSRAFNIIDNVEINDSRMSDAQGGLFPSRITWNEIVFESFQLGFLRNIDFQLCMQFKHPTALRMYRYLGKQFYAKADLTFDLKAFAEVNLGLGRNYEGGTQIARKLKPAIKELEDVGFLEPLPESARFLKKGREWTIRFVQKASPALPDAPSPSEAQPSPLVEKLTSRGITAKVAVDLAARHPADKIEQKIELFDWRLTQPKPPKDPAAYLVKSIVDDYALPKNYVSRAERERRAETKRQDDLAAAEQRRREREEQAREQAIKKAILTYWESLSSEQQAELDAASMTSADPHVLELESGPLKDMGQRLRRDAYIRRLLEQPTTVEA